MVNLGQNFDANQHEPSQAMEPLPAGWYLMQIVGTELRQTKDRSSQFLAFEFEIVEAAHPDLKGRKVWENLNLWHQGNQKAVEIAQRNLSAICHATGVLNVEDTTALHHIPLAVKLKVDPGDAKYEPSNRITGYEAAAARFQAPAAQQPQAQQPAAGPAPAQAAPPAQQPGGAPAPSAAPPWQK